MEIKQKRLVNIDEPTKQIFIYGAEIVGVRQDKLKRVYIWVAPRKKVKIE